MCGACGRQVVPDEVLGRTRTTRDLVEVAAAVNEACCGVPGAPKVARSGDGWSVSRATGGVQLCLTVDELWEAALSGCPAVADRLRRPAPADDGTGLAGRVRARGAVLAGLQPSESVP